MPSVRYAKLRTNECQIARYPNPADLAAMRANPQLKVQRARDRRHQLHLFPHRQEAVRRHAGARGAGDGDRPDSLVKAVFQGSGTPAAVVVPPALWGHDAVAQAVRV